MPTARPAPLFRCLFCFRREAASLPKAALTESGYVRGLNFTDPARSEIPLISAARDSA